MKISILVIGFGNVAQAFVSVLQRKAAFVRQTFGVEIQLVGVVHRAEGEFQSAYSQQGLDLETLLRIRREFGKVSSYPGVGGNDSPIELIMKSGAGLMMEATPTNLRNGEPALTYIRKALEAGMHVVTSNKGPLAFGLSQLRSLASNKGLELRYSASVAGALPIIPTGYYSLMGADITSIEGILNGTTNFILTRMAEKGLAMQEALEEAQHLGIPEADPRLDIEGWDTAVKLLIAANSIMRLDAKIRDVEVTGIENVTIDMVQSVKKKGHALKLIGSARREGSGYEMKVRPEEVEADHPFHSVNGTWKAVMFNTDLLGNVILLGGRSNPEFAGGAMLRDILNIAHDSRQLDRQ